MFLLDQLGLRQLPQMRPRVLHPADPWPEAAASDEAQGSSDPWPEAAASDEAQGSSPLSYKCLIPPKYTHQILYIYIYIYIYKYIYINIYINKMPHLTNTILAIACFPAAIALFHDKSAPSSYTSSSSYIQLHSHLHNPRDLILHEEHVKGMATVRCEVLPAAFHLSLS